MNRVPHQRPPHRSPRSRGAGAAAALAAFAALAAGCGPGEPVAGLSVEPVDLLLAYPETARIEATWTPAAPLDRPIAFVHLLNDQGELVRTFDLPFSGGWRPGEEVVQPIQLWQSALAPPLPAGVYELTMGVVDSRGRRPPLVAAGREVDEGEYAMARVEVPPPPVGGPRLDLTDGWEPAGGDADRQLLGARWLRGEGALEVGGLSGPLDLVLTLRLPAPGEMTAALVPEEGSGEAPSATVTPACGAAPVRLGPGTHEVEIALRPAPGERACTIAIDPDFVYLDTQSLRRIAIELRRVVWSPVEAAPPAAPEAAPPPAGEAAAARGVSLPPAGGLAPPARG